MANLLYAGQTIPLQDIVNVEELADILLDAYGKGGYSWLWVDLEGVSPKRVQLMIGPGIPIAIVGDHADSHEATKADDVPGSQANRR
jgi:hypothetical protein